MGVRYRYLMHMTIVVDPVDYSESDITLGWRAKGNCRRQTANMTCITKKKLDRGTTRHTID